MSGGLSTTAAQLGHGDLEIVARTLWGECRGEARLGRVAVAWVVRNRAERPSWWGRTVAEVCLKASKTGVHQFSCWNAGDPNRAQLEALTPEDKEYLALYEVACDVMLGTAPDPTGGATHYEVVGTGATWAIGKSPSAIIGRHAFYALGPAG